MQSIDELREHAKSDWNLEKDQQLLEKMANIAQVFSLCG